VLIAENKGTGAAFRISSGDEGKLLKGGGIHGNARGRKKLKVDGFGFPEIEGESRAHRSTESLPVKRVAGFPAEPHGIETEREGGAQKSAEVSGVGDGGKHKNRGWKFRTASPVRERD
jgi:hypothetical protein